MAAFAQFGSDLDASTKKQLDRGSRLVEVFKQPAAAPIPVEVQVGILWAVQNDFFDDIEAADAAAASRSLRDYLETQAEAAMTKIREQKKLSDELTEELRSALASWKDGYTSTAKKSA
jgi:F-type H+-transporting ATPase subunit alpha